MTDILAAFFLVLVIATFLPYLVLLIGDFLIGLMESIGL
jgi:hypothetical protein